MPRGRQSRGSSNSVLGPSHKRGGTLAQPARADTKRPPRRRLGCAALPSKGAGRDPADTHKAGRIRCAPGPPVYRLSKQSPGAENPKRRPFWAAGRRPHEIGAHANGEDTPSCPAAGRAGFQPTSSKVADSGSHRGQPSCASPNSVLGPADHRGAPLVPPAGPHTKRTPMPTAWIRRPAQQKDKPRSSRPPRRWLIQVCTGATCPEAAQTVFFGANFQLGGPFGPPAGAHTKGAPTAMAWIRRSAQ